MRIIAGKFKGKQLKEFSLSTTRPTADMVREALFDKIGMLVEDNVFLDLFSGTGAVGIEALSRGAKKCYFVDENSEAINITKQNAKVADLNSYEILKLDYLKALEKFKIEGIKFDFIFLDPPYKTDYAENAINEILNGELISNNGIIIWEHDALKNDYIEKKYPDSTTKKYGKKFLTYLKHDSE